LQKIQIRLVSFVDIKTKYIRQTTKNHSEKASLRKTEITALNENKYYIYKRTASKIASRLFVYIHTNRFIQ
jgi:hypothetical protein